MTFTADMPSWLRRLLVAVVVLALVVGVVRLMSGPSAARTFVGWGLPLSGWCTLDIDDLTIEDDVQILDVRPVVLSMQEARDLLDDAVAEKESVPAVWDAALRKPGRLSCTVRPDGDLQAQEPGENGLTPRAERLRTDVESAFGDIPDGGYLPEGIDTGRVRGSAHYEGRAIDYFFRPVGDEQQRARGWLLSHWLVAHGDEHAVATVIFDDRIWTMRRSAQGWREYVHPSGNRTNEVLRHLDHVHVDVARGT
jgi:hypothetical protein